MISNSEEEIRCPHCGEPLSEQWAKSAIGKLFNARRRRFVGPRKHERECPYCEQKFGSQELRVHLPFCDKRIAIEEARGLVRRRGRPKKYRPCPHCGEQFGYMDLVLHKPVCRRAHAGTKAEREVSIGKASRS